MKLSQRINLGLAATVLIGIMSIGVVLADNHPETAPQMTIVQATQRVLEDHPNSYAVAAKLETEDGVLVYEVELNNKTYVHVNANTGEIVPSES